VIPRVVLGTRGATRLRAGHPWIFRTDVRHEPGDRPGLVRVEDERGRGLGTALYSPASEIRVRWLAPDGVDVDAAWWREMVRRALARREGIDATAFRVVHAEGDGLPSLIVDRFGDHAVAQLLSAGLEAVRGDVVDAIRDVLAPKGLLLRHDAPVRERERLPRGIEPAFGEVPLAIEVREAAVRYVAAPWTGQKTGAFLDQRENRLLVGRLATGRCLDIFAYHGGFALHLAKGGAGEVTAVESSPEALRHVDEAAALNGVAIRGIEANAFDWLRAEADGGERFGVIVLDPPAFAKDKSALERALAGYKELNLRAMRMLAPGGWLFTCSCSHHVHRGDFFAMLGEAAQDAGRRIQLVEMRGAGADHPELLTVPETGYLKGALLRALD
jgi:23S rRNA (cytosine1962-C5)-methyltransferase